MLLASLLSISFLPVACNPSERTAGSDPAAPSQSAPADPDTGSAPSPAALATGSPSDAPPEPDAPPDSTFTGIVGTATKPPSTRGTAVLRDVRTAHHAAFDRVVLEFKGAGLPGYHVEYVDRPVRACGSGDVVALRGDGWLQVRLTPAQAHTEQGQATVQNRARSLDYPNLLDLKATCDFEGEVTWVLGLGSPKRYRVLELQNPSRLVVDVRH